MTTLGIIIICVVAVLVYVVAICGFTKMAGKISKLDFADYFASLTITIGTTAIFSVILFGINALCSTYTVSDGHDIVELQGMYNTSGVEGNFIFGTGEVNDKQYIFYNVKEDGVIRTKKVPYEKCAFSLNDSVVYLEIKYVKDQPGLEHIFTEHRYVDEYVFHLKPENVNREVLYDISKF